MRGVDCVASIRRWGARDTIGQTIMRIVDDIRATSDRDFEIRLQRPFPLMLDALGKLSTQALFVVPERVGTSDPMVPSTETIGSGPFRFVREEWVPGSRTAFAKLDGHVPRSEPPDGAARGKCVLVERVEWRIIPDPAIASAALQTGEVDWYEQPAFDLLQTLARNRDIEIQISDPIGSLAMIRFEHLHPPFDKAAVRRAVMMAVNQADHLAAARRPLSEAGYAGEAVVIISPDRHPCHAYDWPGDGRPAAPARHECRLRRDRLGHRAGATREPQSARSRRLEHLAHRLGRTGRRPPR